MCIKCFTNCECMPYNTMFPLNISKSNINPGVQLARTDLLSVITSSLVTGYIKVGLFYDLDCSSSILWWNADLGSSLSCSVWIWIPLCCALIHFSIACIWYSYQPTLLDINQVLSTINKYFQNYNNMSIMYDCASFKFFIFNLCIA